MGWDQLGDESRPVSRALGMPKGDRPGLTLGVELRFTPYTPHPRGVSYVPPVTYGCWTYQFPREPLRTTEDWVEGLGIPQETCLLLPSSATPR
jgi:hypothetical protein